MRQLELHEKTWMAAAIDGEGTIRFEKNRTKDIQGISVCIYNTSYLFVKNAMMLTQTGKIYNRRMESKSLLTQYQWSIHRQAEVGELLGQIKDYLIIKKYKAIEALDWLNDRPRQILFSKSISAKKRWRSDEYRDKIRQNSIRQWQKHKELHGVIPLKGTTIKHD